MSIVDKELDEMLHGEEKPYHPDTLHVSLTDLEKNREVRKERMTANTTQQKKVPEKSTHEPTAEFKKGKWEPIKERTWMDNLRDGCKWVALFGGLSFLFWYWQISGLMDSSVSVPSMCVCTALAGWNLGRCARG